MGSPLEDYAAKCWDEAREEKYREKEYNNCSACGNNFCPEDQHGATEGEFMVFCPKCVESSSHIAYIRDLGMTTAEANIAINDLKFI